MDDIISIKADLERIEKELSNKLLLLDNQIKGNEEDEIKINDKINIIPDVISLNIGGVEFHALKQTLLLDKKTLFYSSLVNLKYDSILQGIYFERSFEYFEIILNYLKYNYYPFDILDFSILKTLKEEAEYYNIQSIVDAINSSPAYLLKISE